VYVVEVRHRREGVDDAQEHRRGVGEEAVWGGGSSMCRWWSLSFLPLPSLLRSSGRWSSSGELRLDLAGVARVGGSVNAVGGSGGAVEELG
jgi:hypothetical protein